MKVMIVKDYKITTIVKPTKNKESYEIGVVEEAT
jgi:hypothetical protein